MSGLAGAPAVLRALGLVARSAGQTLEALGTGMQVNGQVDKLVPSTRVVSLRGKELQHGLQNFVASSASVVGDVRMGELSSVWYGAVVRGDKAPVRLGRNVAVLDNASVSGSAGGGACEVGDDVVIAPGASVQSARIGAGAMVGMGAQILPGASVGAESFVDAGAVVQRGAVIPPGQLWTGVPAAHLRSLSPEEMSYLRATAGAYSDLSAQHGAQGRKTVAEVEFDAHVRLLRAEDGFAPNEPIENPDPDVMQYYKLTAHGPEHGLFRPDAEMSIAEERAAREAEEIAADRAEEAHHARVARSKRVGEAMCALAATPIGRGVDARTAVVAALEARDPSGTAELLGLIAAASAAAGASSAGGSDAHKLAVVSTISTLIALQPQTALGALPPQTEAEARAAALAVFDALAKHAAAGGLSLPALEGGASAGAAQLR